MRVSQVQIIFRTRTAKLRKSSNTPRPRTALTPTQTAIVAFVFSAVFSVVFVYFYLTRENVKALLTLIAVAYSVGIGIRRARRGKPAPLREAQSEDTGESIAV